MAVAAPWWSQSAKSVVVSVVYMPEMTFGGNGTYDKLCRLPKQHFGEFRSHLVLHRRISPEYKVNIRKKHPGISWHVGRI
jgi:hypothetical protein